MSDIINIEDVPKRGRGRPPKAEVSKGDFRRPQTVSFIAAVLGKDRRTVERKLAGLTPEHDDGKSVLYDFPQACEAIFRSETGLSAAALADLRPEQLPPITQAAFWNAQKQRIAVYREASNLWRSEDIEEAVDAVVKVFRDAMVSLPEKLRMAQKAGKTHQDVAYGILEMVEEQAGRSLRELRGQSFSAELALIEEQMTVQEMAEAGEIPEDD